MIDSIKDLFRRYQVLIYNFSYLSALQLFSIILPLLTYPYLIRVLGSEKYGMIVFAQAVVGYLLVIVSFGFKITGTKEVSLYRDDRDKLNEILSSIFIIKGVLIFIAFLLLTIIIHVVPEASNNKVLFYLSMWICFYDFIFPVFYFQGIEKMKYITIITMISRMLFLLLIFLLIKDENDYLKVPLINGIGALLSGGISIIILYKHGFKFKLQKYAVLKTYLLKSYTMALAFFSNTFKVNLNVIVVKMLFSYTEVAYFDLALKIVNICNTFLDLISQTIFPKMSLEKNAKFLRKVIKLSLIISVVAIVFLQIFSDKIIIILGGLSMLPAIEVLRVLAFFIPIYILGALLGRNCLIVYGFDRYVLISMLLSGSLYSLTLLFINAFNYNISILWLCFLFLFSFAVETFYRYYICRIKNLL